LLPQGVVDIDKNIPPVDIQLIGTTSKILIRNDLHPEIVQLLLQTMKEVHSGSDIFHRNGEYPNGTDAEYTIAATAIDFYKNGPSFMQRHLPLWLCPRAKGDRGAGDRVSNRISVIPLPAPTLQLDDASAPVLLVRSAQVTGGFVRCQFERQAPRRQTSRNRSHRGRREPYSFSVGLLRSGVQPAKSH
jgi:hypothetical protein